MIFKKTVNQLLYLYFITFRASEKENSFKGSNFLDSDIWMGSEAQKERNKNKNIFLPN